MTETPDQTVRSAPVPSPATGPSPQMAAEAPAAPKAPGGPAAAWVFRDLASI